MVTGVTPKRTDRRRAWARSHTLQQWRGLPEPKDAAARQHEAGTLVTRLMDSLGLSTRFREEEIAAAWSGIAGDFAAQYSHPQRLKNGSLTVAVSQSAVLWTLDRAKGTLLARLQEKFGARTIRELRFRNG